MLFIIIMLIGTVMITGGLVIRFRSENKYFSDNASALFGVGLTIVLLMSIVTLSVYLNNLSRITEMQAFHDETAAVYKQAIDEANNTAIVAGHLPKDRLDEVLKIVAAMGASELVNLDNLSQSSNITELIRDYRNGIRIYNARLAKYLAYKKNIWVWPMMPEIPGHLELMSY